MKLIGNPMWGFSTVASPLRVKLCSAKKITQAEAAKRLGCSREHLNRVVNGGRASKSLLSRYRALIEAEAAK